VVIRTHPPPAAITTYETKGGGDRPYGPSWSSRSPVIARNGIAATSHPLATQVAIDVLKRGGNAADAAIAANAVLGLMEPTGSGVGGDLMVILWDPVNKTVVGLNAGGRSSFNISFEEMQKNIDYASYLPPFGPYPVNVPGTVDGWFQLYNRFGSRNLNMSDLLKYAIDYANDGFPLTQIIAGSWQSNVRAINRSLSGEPYLKNFMDTYTRNGTLIKAGEIHKNPDLARTLTAIAEGGRDAFYNGPLTDVMVKKNWMLFNQGRFRQTLQYLGRTNKY